MWGPNITPGYWRSPEADAEAFDDEGFLCSGVTGLQTTPAEESRVLRAVLIHHNPGITSRQLCAVLDISPPNLVAIINMLEGRELIIREPHPTDHRKMRPAPDAQGEKFTRSAACTAEQPESPAAAARNRAFPAHLRELLHQAGDKIAAWMLELVLIHAASLGRR